MGSWVTTLAAKSLTGYARKPTSPEEFAEIESVDESMSVQHIEEMIADRRRAEGLTHPFGNRLPMLAWMNPTRN